MMGNQATSLYIALLMQSTDSWQSRCYKAQSFGKEIQAKYLCFCDPAQPFHRFLLAVGHAMTASTILSAIRPMHKLSGSTPPRVDSPFVLQMVVNSLQAGEKIHPEADGWRWIFWVQWHALAVALAGLCSIRNTDLARRAWTLVDQAYEINSSSVANMRNGMLWRPVEKLYKKARAFRDGLDGTETSRLSPSTANLAGSGNTQPAAIDTVTPQPTTPLQSNQPSAPLPST